MVEAQSPETSAPEATGRKGHRALRLSRTMTRVGVALSVTVGVLAVAAPSWAGPMMGC